MLFKSTFLLSLTALAAAAAVPPANEARSIDAASERLLKIKRTQDSIAAVSVVASADIASSTTVKTEDPLRADLVNALQDILVHGYVVGTYDAEIPHLLRIFHTSTVQEVNVLLGSSYTAEQYNQLSYQLGLAARLYSSLGYSGGRAKRATKADTEVTYGTASRTTVRIGDLQVDLVIVLNGLLNGESVTALHADERRYLRNLFRYQDVESLNKLLGSSYTVEQYNQLSLYLGVSHLVAGQLDGSSRSVTRVDGKAKRAKAADTEVAYGTASRTTVQLGDLRVDLVIVLNGLLNGESVTAVKEDERKYLGLLFTYLDVESLNRLLGSSYTVEQFNQLRVYLGVSNLLASQLDGSSGSITRVDGKAKRATAA
ncbi:hypothetical protein JCM10213_003710 [Rhodosporidiobolus nylandii]